MFEWFPNILYMSFHVSNMYSNILWSRHTLYQPLYKFGPCRLRANGSHTVRVYPNDTPINHISDVSILLKPCAILHRSRLHLMICAMLMNHLVACLYTMLKNLPSNNSTKLSSTDFALTSLHTYPTDERHHFPNGDGLNAATYTHLVKTLRPARKRLKKKDKILLH